MTRALRVLPAALLAFGLCPSGPVGATPERADSAAEAGVLLLRNGNVLSGTICRDGDRYRVGRKEGEIEVPDDRVRYVARDLDGLYLRCRKALEPDDALGHLRLANWCVRNQLVERAEGELAEARRLAPAHRGIVSIERRLKWLVEALAVTPSVESDAAGPRRPASARGRGPASRPPVDPPNIHVPEQVMRDFTTRIQPILLNRCAMAACHGSRSPSHFQLERIGAGHRADVRVTRRNLEAVLRETDPDDPAGSPLLAFPIRPHGPQDQPVLGRADTSQYEALVRWVPQVAWRRRPIPAPKGQNISAQGKAPWLGKTTPQKP